MNTNTLKGKIAVVTGATRGIGRAIAERLLDEGMSVAICGRLQKSVDGAVRELSTKGPVFGMTADVSDLMQVETFVAAVDNHYGGVDVLINNAGSGRFGPVAELSPQDWHQMIGTNLTGVYYSCRAILPILRKRSGGGDVINVSSLAGANAFAGGSAYNASKFGLNGFSEAMMLDYRHEGIRVSYVMPGSVDTEFGGGTTGSSGNQESGGDWKINPADIADVVVTMLAMPRRTTVSRVEIRPSRPPRKG
jgi:3-oxoacyl-[acyl-carrier protein] reductase